MRSQITCDWLSNMVLLFDIKQDVHVAYRSEEITQKNVINNHSSEKVTATRL